MREGHSASRCQEKAAATNFCFKGGDAMSSHPSKAEESLLNTSDHPPPQAMHSSPQIPIPVTSASV